MEHYRLNKKNPALDGAQAAASQQLGIASAMAGGEAIKARTIGEEGEGFQAVSR